MKGRDVGMTLGLGGLFLMTATSIYYVLTVHWLLGLFSVGLWCLGWGLLIDKSSES